MVADLSASTYLVDGTDLQVSGVDLLHDGSGLWDGVGEDVSVSNSAGADGAEIVGGLFRQFTHSIMFEVAAASPAAAWTLIVALRRRCKPGRTVTLTRRMPDPDGTDANTDHTATARQQGAPRVEWVERNNRARVDVDFLVTSGPWLGAAVTIADASGTHTILGDLRTRAITATLSAGAVNPVVTNDNGYTFRFVGTVPAGGVSVDVLRHTAKRLSDSVDVSSSLRWGKGDPFQLEPGANTITVSAGTCGLTYYPAYA